MEKRSRKKTSAKISVWQILLIAAGTALVTFVLFFVFLPKVSLQSPPADSVQAAASSAQAAGGEEMILPQPEGVVSPENEEIFDRPAAEPQEISITVQAKPTEPETAAPQPFTLLFAGDILFDSHYAVMASLLERTGGKPAVESAFDEAALEQMRNADFFMVNNEFPYSTRGVPLAGKTYTFRADPAYAKLLTDMGADLTALANNHMFDHGEQALLDTLDTLNGLKMPYVGAGRNIEEASAPYLYEAEGVKVAFLSATQIERFANPDTRGASENQSGVFRCLDDTLLLEKIKEAKASADLVVVYVHWGTESTDKIDEHQKKLAKNIAGAGADLIVGDHPHVLQGIEYFGDVPCIYSLGNYWFNSKNQDSCLFEATVDPETKKISMVRFLPMRQENCRVKTPEAGEAARIIEYMNTISAAHIDAEGYVTKE